MRKGRAMAEDMAYPTEDMTAVSHDLQPFIESQWAQHTALFMNNQDSFSILLEFVARIVPNDLMNYHKQYQDAYLALHDLAVQIDNAASTMTAADESVSQSF